MSDTLILLQRGLIVVVSAAHLSFEWQNIVFRPVWVQNPRLHNFSNCFHELGSKVVMGLKEGKML